MEISLNLILAAFGLSFIIEAIPWIISPSTIRAMLEALSNVSDQTLRTLATALFVFGAILFWLASVI